MAIRIVSKEFVLLLPLLLLILAALSGNCDTPLYKVNKSTTSKPRSIAVDEPQLCRPRQGYIGVCLYHYLCSKGTTIVTAGDDLIDIRIPDGCGIAEVCCPYDLGVDVQPPVTEHAAQSCAAQGGGEGTCVARGQCAGQRDAYSPSVDRREGDGCPSGQVCCANNSDVFWDKPWPTDETSDEKGKPTLPKCGQKKAGDGDTTWIVLIKDPSLRVSRRKSPRSRNIYDRTIGGGSLIHPTVVLTAAQLVSDRRDLQVVAVGDGQKTDVDEVIQHENYQGNPRHDIALLLLQDPMQLSERVGVVCLPPIEGIFTDSCGIHILGTFGKSKTPELRMFTHVTDVWHAETGELNDYVGYNLAPKRMLPDGFPLICSVTGEDSYVQHGIEIRDCTKDCTIQNQFVVLNVAVFRDWIEEKLKLNNLNTDTFSIEYDDIGDHDE